MVPLPYGRQWIGEEEARSAAEVLASDWITQGPRVESFEEALARRVGARHAAAFANGTLALAAMMHASGVGPGDEVITSPLTFVATANAVLHAGGTPVFADIDPRTGNLDPVRAEQAVTSKTRAIIAVDYAGHPCEYEALRDLARRRGLALFSDAAHALGAEYRGKPVGSLADMTVFSFHPVKHITTGEGGAATTDDADLARKLRRYRNHGIEKDPARMTRHDGPWHYEVQTLGINGRLTDFQCAMGLEQLKKLDRFVERRRSIAGRYRQAFQGRGDLRLPEELEGARHSYHLYVIRVLPGRTRLDRKELFEELRRRGLGVQVHYLPVPDHPYYRERFGDVRRSLPEAFRFYETCVSIPLFPRMSDDDVGAVIERVRGALDGHET